MGPTYINIALTAVVALIAYLVKRMLEKFETRLDSHDEVLFNLNGTIQRLIGANERWNGRTERRTR